MTYGDDDLRALEERDEALASAQGGFVLTEAGQVAAELAKKVEQLEAEVERLTLDGIHTCHDQCRRIACVQRREIARLHGRIADIEKRHERLAIAEHQRTRDWTRCEHCEKRVSFDDAVSVEDWYFCKPCYAEMEADARNEEGAARHG